MEKLQTKESLFLCCGVEKRKKNSIPGLTRWPVNNILTLLRSREPGKLPRGHFNGAVLLKSCRLLLLLLPILQ